MTYAGRLTPRAARGVIAARLSGDTQCVDEAAGLYIDKVSTSEDGLEVTVVDRSARVLPECPGVQRRGDASGEDHRQDDGRQRPAERSASHGCLRRTNHAKVPTSTSRISQPNPRGHPSIMSMALPRGGPGHASVAQQLDQVALDPSSDRVAVLERSSSVTTTQACCPPFADEPTGGQVVASHAPVAVG